MFLIELFRKSETGSTSPSYLRSLGPYAAAILTSIPLQRITYRKVVVSSRDSTARHLISINLSSMIRTSTRRRLSCNRLSLMVLILFLLKEVKRAQLIFSHVSFLLLEKTPQVLCGGHFSSLFFYDLPPLGTLDPVYLNL